MQKQVEKIEKILASKNLEIMFARIAANLLRRNNVEEAIQICEHGLKKFSTYAQGHYILAKCYLQKGMTAEAKAEFERVLKFDFTHINSLNALAKIYKAAGLKNYYQEFLLKLFIIDPLNKEVSAEVKDIGQYDKWIITSDTVLESTAAGGGTAEILPQAEESIPPQSDKTAGKKTDRPLVDIYEPDKIDLSQYNNVRDDFTTILQGSQDSSPASVVPADKKTEWTEDITYSYSDDTLRDEQTVSADTENGGEEIKTAVQDLSFDEETEKIIDKERAKESDAPASQITLDFQTGTEADKVAGIQSTAARGSRDLPELTADQMGPGRPEDNEKSFRSPLISPEDEEELPFKPPKIISQTLGEILVSQKKYSEALEVFRILRQKNPDNKSFDKKIEFLQKIITLEKGQTQ